MFRNNPVYTIFSSSDSNGSRSTYFFRRFGIPAGVMVCIFFSLTLLAFGSRSFLTLVSLSAANILIIIISRVGLTLFIKEARYFLFQTAFISGLYILRFGLEQGIFPGLRTSWQIMLAFLPGAILMKTIPQSMIVQCFARIIPYRLAFVLSTCLRFIPLLIGEAKSIYEIQLLRGARILPENLFNPKNWPDFIHCLVVPLVVQGLKIARDISLAAIARDFGMRKRRTYWQEK